VSTFVRCPLLSLWKQEVIQTCLNPQTYPIYLDSSCHIAFLEISSPRFPHDLCYNKSRAMYCNDADCNWDRLSAPMPRTWDGHLLCCDRAGKSYCTTHRPQRTNRRRSSSFVPTGRSLGSHQASTVIVDPGAGKRCIGITVHGKHVMVTSGFR
jgi:hypothetical protein